MNKQGRRQVYSGVSKPNAWHEQQLSMISLQEEQELLAFKTFHEPGKWW